MRVWRVTRKHFANPPLNGVGGLFASGRWHTQGHPIIYTSGSPSLAILETLVHFDPALEPTDLVMIRADIDQINIQYIEPVDLPKNWKNSESVLREMGDKWLLSQSACILRVPSVLTPGGEYNYLINPQHPEFNDIQNIQISDFSLDARLLV